ncbi:MAG: hypothetical protein HY902_02435 [Deltaproteobacteria bacterium]|nr:hypothetical protein [Deltaproteobacteria bacterium]
MARLRLGDASLAAAAWGRMQNPAFEARAGAVGTQVEAQLDVWLPVEAGDQPAARRGEARAMRDWLAVQQLASLAEVRGWAVQQWGRAVVAAARVRLLSEITATADQEAQALVKRAQVRDAREQDAQLARMEVVRFAGQLAMARAEFARAITTLSLVLGEVPERSEHAVSPATPLPLPQAASLDTLPQVAVLLREVEVHRAAEQRAIAEAQPPWQGLLGAGRDAAGGLRVNAGVAWSPPIARAGQVERARAQAERLRAEAEAEATRRQTRVQWLALAGEDRALADADRDLHSQGRAAGQATLAAATATWRSGKGDWMAVLLARRNLAEVELRHLDLAERRWSLRGEWVAATGERF